MTNFYVGVDYSCLTLCLLAAGRVKANKLFRNKMINSIFTKSSPQDSHYSNPKSSFSAKSEIVETKTILALLAETSTRSYLGFT